MPTAKEIVKDENFWALPVSERRKVLDKVDVNFARLPISEKNKFLARGSEKLLGPESDRPGPYREPQDVKATQAWESALSENAPQVVGGLVGGLTMGPEGIPLGAAAGKGYQFAYDALRGKPVPEKMTDRAADMAWSGGVEYAGDLVGRGIIGGAQKVLAPFSKKVTPHAVRAIEFLQQKTKMSPPITPAEATQSTAMSIIENVSENSMLGGGRLVAYKLNREKVMGEIADDLIDQFGKRAEPGDIGKLVLDTVEGNFDAAKATTAPIYNAIDEMTKATDVKPGAMVSLKAAKDFAKKRMESAVGAKGLEAEHSGDDILKTVLSMDDVVDYSTAKEIRTRIMAAESRLSSTNKKAPAIGISKQLVKEIDSGIEEGLKSFDETVYDMWRGVNADYNAIKKQYNNQFLKRLIKRGDDTADRLGEPEAIADMIFKPGAVSNIKKVKVALGSNSKSWEQLQGYYLRSLMSKSVDAEGHIVGEKVLKNLYGRSGMGHEALNEIFSSSQLKEIKEFANALRVQQSKPVVGTGKVWIQLKQAGAAGAFLGGAATGNPTAGTLGAATILLGPGALARVLLNPRAAKWLTTGIKLPPKTAAYSSILTRLSRASWQIENDHRKYLQSDEE